jgi:phage shock protein PspC (stress-responsive transcriptional regulator)
VCEGIAKAFDIDPALVRMIFVFLTGFTGIVPGIITYFTGWLVTPMKGCRPPLARLLKREKGIPTEKVNVAASVE